MTSARDPVELRHGPVSRPGVTAGCNRRLYVVTYNHMVVDQWQDAQTDRVFHALADGTRRDILVRALDGQHSVSALARNYSMSVTAVQKHVAVLERAGLVGKHRHGREQLVRGNADTMRRAVELLEKLEAAWRGRIDRIGDLLATDRNGGRKP